jgi:predicted  nucleic acid-binding Zn-ribbon protein
MSRISQLYDLQQIDSAIDSRAARLRQIEEQMADSPQLLSARAANQQAQDRLAQEQARLRQASRQVEETSARIRTQEKRLYDGSIKNPKELAQIQEEVWHLKARLKEQEDRVIEAMLAVEEAEAAARARQEELDLVAREWQQFTDGLLEEKDKLLEQTRALQVKRQRAMAGVPWADLQAYERLRRSKGGVAVAAVRDGVCGGCHVSVAVGIVRQARSGDSFVLCPSCGRILYPVGEVKYTEFDHSLDNINR